MNLECCHTRQQGIYQRLLRLMQEALKHTYNNKKVPNWLPLENALGTNRYKF